MNEPNVAYRNKLLLVLIADLYRHVVHCKAFYFQARAPEQ